MATMRAMLLTKLSPIEENPLKLSEIDRHEIRRPDEILIRIEACGVCHSQLHGIEGDWKELGIPPQIPTVPGHELVGEVVEIGGSVSKFKIGDRAGISPLLESCMECRYCTEGKEQLCDSMSVLGESLKGGYAEYVTVRESFATKIPPDMAPEYAAPLFCAGITAYKAVKASEPAAGKSVGIFGIGGVGHMAVQFARLEGMHVIAISRNGEHLNMAKELGASETVRFDTQEGTLAELAGKAGLLDAAIVLAPSDLATETAVKSVKKGGIIVVATVGSISGFVAFEEKTIRGTLIGSRKDMEDVVRIADEGDLSVITETYPLEEANAVLKRLKDSKIMARAVLIP